MRAFLSGTWCGLMLLVASSALAQDFDAGAKRFLLHQKSWGTGIPASFIDIDDPALVGQAATYDLALAGLGFLYLGDYESARRILAFFERKWGPGGLCNFYDTQTGECGIEATVHLGPHMWVATLALQYTAQTQDRTFFPLAQKIAAWGIRLNHNDGALAMGPFRDWGSDWPHVFGAESNIVAYSVYRALSRMEKDVSTKVAFELEMQGIRDFLHRIVLVKDSQGGLQDVVVGTSIPGGVTKISACDVISMLLLVFSPDELKEFFSVSADDLVHFAKNRFWVEEDGISGFDFADQQTASAAQRSRMISLEWTLQMACALRSVPLREAEADLWVSEIDKKAVDREGMRFYPYATKDALQVFPFAPWWKTPAGDAARSGSMASTMWRLFYEKDKNPLGLYTEN